MPRSALKYIDVDYCLPIEEIADLMPRLAETEALACEGATPVVPARELALLEARGRRSGRAYFPARRTVRT